MPYDGDDRDWGDDHGDDWKKPPRETITHWHPSLPFVEITQTRYPEERTAEDDRFETWGFEILGPKEAEGYPLASDGVAHTRGDHTEAEMIADMAYRADVAVARYVHYSKIFGHPAATRSSVRLRTLASAANT